MALFTQEITRKLAAQGATRSESNKPVVKLFNPCGAATWLISESDPEDADRLFGLCDMGFGCPEMGYVSLAEIEATRLPYGLKIERDRHFTAEMTLVEYADAASDPR